MVRLWNLNICIENVNARLTGAEDISYDVITLGTYFLCFLLHSHSFTLRTDSRKSDSSEIYFKKFAQYFGLTWIWRQKKRDKN